METEEYSLQVETKLWKYASVQLQPTNISQQPQGTVSALSTPTPSFPSFN